MSNHHSWLCWPFLIIRWEEFAYVNKKKFSTRGHVIANSPLSRIIIHSHICVVQQYLKIFSNSSASATVFFSSTGVLTVSTQRRSRQVGLHYKVLLPWLYQLGVWQLHTLHFTLLCWQNPTEDDSHCLCSGAGVAVPAVIPLHQHMLHLHQGV